MPVIDLRPGALRLVARTVPPAVAALSLVAATPSLVVAAIASVLAMITITSLSYQWPGLPGVAREPGHARWWWVTAAGFALAAWSSRDPARHALAALRRRVVADPTGRGVVQSSHEVHR